MKQRKAFSLNAYIGYGLEAKEYLDHLDHLAKMEKKTRSDFVLDAVEFYIKSKGIAPKPIPQTLLQRLPDPPKRPQERSISYDELEDPPAPRINTESIPSGKPEKIDK